MILPGGRRIEIRLASPGRYRLACLARGRLLVEYTGDGTQHRRHRLGRDARYEFRSVEQLRYDFERDVADAAVAD